MPSLNAPKAAINRKPFQKNKITTAAPLGKVIYPPFIQLFKILINCSLSSADISEILVFA